MYGNGNLHCIPVRLHAFQGRREVPVRAGREVAGKTQLEQLRNGEEIGKLSDLDLARI